MARSQTILAAIALAGVQLSSCKSSGGSQSPGSTDGGEASLTVSRGPQLAQVSTTSVLIAWLSSRSSVGTVEYGLDDSYGARMDSQAPGVEHVVHLEGLLAGTSYRYRLLLDGLPATDGRSFRTAPADPDAPFRVVVFGDTGSGSANQAAVASRVLASAPDLVLIPGDVVYDRGSAAELDPHYFVPFADLLDHIPFYPALGNHDVSTANASPLIKALYLPVNDVDATERFYSFDHANAHFVALDSNSSLDSGSVQLSWLDADLGRSASLWKIVYFHHPPYSSSSHGSSFGVRRSLTPLLDRHHVDIVFSGHDHDYERTFPMLAEQVVGADEEPEYSEPAGTIFVVTGGGGRSLYPSGKSSFTAFSVSAYHIVQVDVEGASLVLRAVAVDGTVLDQVQVRKSVTP